MKTNLTIKMAAAALLLASFLTPNSLTQANDSEESTPMEIRPVLFEPGATPARWRVINDSVMGGISESEYAENEAGVFTFQGAVSLENNGGFASVRSAPIDFDLDGATEIRLRVRGDGSIYSFRARTNDRWDGPAYVQDFQTVKDEWIEVILPINEFYAQFRGYRLNDAPPLDPAKIRQIGFLIANKQVGEFKLEIDSVHAVFPVSPSPEA